MLRAEDEYTALPSARSRKPEYRGADALSSRHRAAATGRLCSPSSAVMHTDLLGRASADGAQVIL